MGFGISEARRAGDLRFGMLGVGRLEVLGFGNWRRPAAAWFDGLGPHSLIRRGGRAAWGGIREGRDVASSEFRVWRWCGETRWGACGGGPVGGDPTF